MFFSSDSKALRLSDFESFSTYPSLNEEAVIGKKIWGNGLKAISSLSVQRVFGGTSSIVADFKKALSDKYGEEIAEFVFPPTNQQTALSKGLTKKTIAATLKKASLLEEVDFLKYKKAFQIKESVTIKIVETLETKSCYQAARKKYQELQSHIQDFTNTLTYFDPDLNLSEDNLKMLQSYFKEKLRYISEVSQEIAALAEPSEIEKKIIKIFGKSKVSESMVAVVKQHDEVMVELLRPQSRSLKSTPALNPSPLIKMLEKANALLTSFSTHFHEENKSIYFSLNQRGEIITQHELDASGSHHAQMRAAAAFFNALKESYGDFFIDELKPKDEQNNPLSINEAIDIFQKIQNSFQDVSDFLSRQPLLVTTEYIEQLSTHEDLAVAAKSDHETLGSNSSLFLRLTREAVSLSALELGYHFGIIVYNTTLATTSLSCAPVLFAIGASAAAGAAAGKFVTLQQTSEMQREAIGTAAAASTGGTLGDIGSILLTQSGGFIGKFLEAHIPFSGFLTSLALSYAGGTAAVSIRNAFFGGAVSGALHAEDNLQETLPASANSTLRGAREDESSINLDEEIYPETRLLANLGAVIDVISKIPMQHVTIQRRGI